LYVAGGFDEGLARALLAHPNADMRAWTVRLLGDENRVSVEMAGRLRELAAGEADVTVRCQLACTAKRLPPEQALPIVRALLSHGEDAADPYMPLLSWWAVERHAVAARNDVVALFSDASIRQLPLAHDTIVPRLIRRYAAEDSEPGYLACATLLQTAPPSDRSLLVASLDQGLQDRGVIHGGSAGTLFADLAATPADRVDRENKLAKTDRLPEALQTEIDRDWRNDTCDLGLIRLSARLGRDAAQKRAVALAMDSNAPAATRVAAVQLLGEINQPRCVDTLLTLLSNNGPADIQGAALDALAVCNDPRIGGELLAHYARCAANVRPHIAAILLGRKTWAGQFLAAIDQGDFPAEEVAVDQLRVVAMHDDDDLDRLVKKHWGRVQPGTPEERLAEMRRINNDLRAGAGDAAAGKLLFVKHCGTCHRLHGEGNQIGPELTHANRKNLAELLNTVVDPSAVVRREFLSYVAHTNEGRVLTGLLVDQSLGSVTLLDAKNQRTVVPRNRIDSLTESPTSLMPENLLSPLKPQELRDLFAYLQSEEPH
jgi:putative heme-binding domain-containing protein